MFLSYSEYMTDIYPYKMEDGKIVSIYIDSEIIPISPFPFDKLTDLIAKAKEYYDAKSAFEKAKHNFDRFKSEFESFTHGSITEPESFTHPPESEIPEDVQVSPPERVILPPSPHHNEPEPVLETPHTIESDAEHIISHVKILSILKRSGKTASKEDIKSVISKYTDLDPDKVSDKVIELLKEKGKIR